MVWRFWKAARYYRKNLCKELLPEGWRSVPCYSYQKQATASTMGIPPILFLPPSLESDLGFDPSSIGYVSLGMSGPQFPDLS